MQGIGNNNPSHPAQNHPSENSRRPGTSDHPGRHLGHAKADKAEHPGASRFEQVFKSNKAEPTNQPVAAEQDEVKPENPVDVDTETTAEKVARNGQAQRGSNSEVDDRITDIQLKHLQDSGDAVAEQISFTGKTHAISTGFF